METIKIDVLKIEKCRLFKGAKGTYLDATLIMRNVFVFTPSVSIYINPQKADCLNDGKHDYKMTNTFPSESSRMQCTACGDVQA